MAEGPNAPACEEETRLPARRSRARQPSPRHQPPDRGWPEGDWRAGGPDRCYPRAQPIHSGTAGSASSRRGAMLSPQRTQ